MKSFEIAVLPGDGVGKEIAQPSMELVTQVSKHYGVALTPTYLEAGAELYKRTGIAFPEEHFEAAARADAIYLGAMGLPSVRYPDGTEIGPQHDLRKRLKLYAGVRPCITMPGLPLPLKDKRAAHLDFVIVRESIEGIFASPRRSEFDTDDSAYNIIRVSSAVSQKLFDYSFNLARRRQIKGHPGKVTCVDKANVLSSMYFFRQNFDRVKEHHLDIQADYMYVDAMALNLIRRPWTFDVCPTENLCGDILSDIASALMGGMGMAPSGEIGDNHALFQPCHGSAPDIAFQGKANPTGMILSGAMMLDYLNDRFDCPEAALAAEHLTQAVRQAYATGALLPYELGGQSGLAEISSAILTQLEKPRTLAS